MRVIIPAHNEVGSVVSVIGDIPDYVEEIIVVDNASDDNTAQAAKAARATVLYEPKMGYGHACLKGIDYVAGSLAKQDVVVFLDADYSDQPEEMDKLIIPILEGKVDFVVGARVSRFRESGSMTFPQIFGNKLATVLMRLFFNSTFTDLGPFRAIKFGTLQQLQMTDKTYGWTVEMQLKVLKKNIPYMEVPVHYRKRIGHSKVSGTIKGAVMAGVKILSWIFKYGFAK